MSADFEKLRREYKQKFLDEKNMHPDPIVQFGEWFRLAVDVGIDLPNAMVLATASNEGKPAARFVLLKDYDKNGFVFYTHSVSAKGRQLEKNPQAALIFYWSNLDRQVRIEGKAERTSDREADEYFASRPHDSRISAWAAPQSSVIKNREYLESRVEEFRQKFGDGDVPRPEDWVGYRVIPVAVEFWQGRENRLHDRILYTLCNGGRWNISRLAP